MKKKRLVVLSGAGISAESGLKTFRDHNGLWEGHNVMDVASIEGWYADPEKVLTFYNLRRKNLCEARPNQAHHLLADLEDDFEVRIVTQNVDDLHERAGSTQVLHLHGELFKVRSERNPDLVYDWTDDLHWGDLAEDGAQLRPDVVWFGEAVPRMEQAMDWVRQADIFLVVGTSLLVYPAAGLVDFAPQSIPKYVIDPKVPEGRAVQHLIPIPECASKGMEIVCEQLTTLS